MNDSLRLETLSATSTSAPGEVYAELSALLARAAEIDGQSAFNDQTMVDARAGRASVTLAYSTEATIAEPPGENPAAHTLVGAMAINDGTLELVVDPPARRRGIGDALVDQALHENHVPFLTRVLEPFLSAHNAPTAAWAHGDHPAARALAATHAFHPTRRLLQLRMPLTGAVPETPTEFTIDSFSVGTDDEAWIALNSRVFAGHPEQGRLTVDDLRARMAEPWFEPDDFLLARDPAGELIGYNWLKIEPGEPGEIYVVGVAPDYAGRGLGRALMQRGLNRLVTRGCSVAALYVEEDNSPAVPLYRSLGFTDHAIDVLYSR